MSNTTQRRILEQLVAGTINLDQAENQLFEAANKNFRMTDRGAVVVLGIQRRALVLYPNQWRQLNNRMPQLIKYIDHNIQELSNRQKLHAVTNMDVVTETEVGHGTCYAEQCIGETADVATKCCSHGC